MMAVIEAKKQKIFHEVEKINKSNHLNDYEYKK